MDFTPTPCQKQRHLMGTPSLPLLLHLPISSGRFGVGARQPQRSSLSFAQWGGSTPSSPLSGGCGFGRIPSAGTGGECTSCTRTCSPARTRTCRSCGRSSSTRTATRRCSSSSSETLEEQPAMACIYV
ncbi:hypothetical protein C2845_PM03G23550 [Panicum miliaceum]|uniref:Uncharacterized protein n=1 Tax=Panicum miliaceum TaxID=4540 RepID=A0A3L6T7C0_PANMI|nr:hypothetical protein C2845_PM03G23550 [Panicum miliaceum]